MTNLTLVATVLFSTNVVMFYPSSEERLKTESVFATVTVPGWVTNTVGISTNTTRYAWCEVPLKMARDPLSIRYSPPMPPAFPTSVTNTLK